MSATFRLSPISESRPFYLAIIAGLACAFVIGKTLPLTMDAISAVIEPPCANTVSPGSTQGGLAPINPHALPKAAGKRGTIVRGFYGPRGAHPCPRHGRSGPPPCSQGGSR